jgi:hypothetical protein
MSIRIKTVSRPQPDVAGGGSVETQCIASLPKAGVIFTSVACLQDMLKTAKFIKVSS